MSDTGTLIDEGKLYSEAVEIVRRDGKASTSYIQRRLQIGYNRAASLIEQMEIAGIITAPDHKGVRHVVGHTPAPEPAVPTVTVMLDKPCLDCKNPGATQNGLCLRCTNDAMNGRVLHTPRGQEIARQIQANMAKLAPEKQTVAKGAFAKDQLRSFINRVERLEEEKAALSADIKEVMAEAKGTGFDTKIMRQVIRLRKLDKADFQEQEAMLDLYLTAMDMR